MHAKPPYMLSVSVVEQHVCIWVQAAEAHEWHCPAGQGLLSGDSGPQMRSLVKALACMQACSLGFSSCILASPNIDPSVLLRRVMPLLAPSASFAIFSNWLQPLADCMFKLQVVPPILAVCSLLGRIRPAPYLLSLHANRRLYGHMEHAIKTAVTLQMMRIDYTRSSI